MIVGIGRKLYSVSRLVRFEAEGAGADHRLLIYSPAVLLHDLFTDDVARGIGELEHEVGPPLVDRDLERSVIDRFHAGQGGRLAAVEIFGANDIVQVILARGGLGLLAETAGEAVDEVFRFELTAVVKLHAGF